MSEPTPSVPVVRLPSRRVVAGVALALAGLLAVGGTFAAMYTYAVTLPLGLATVQHTFVVTSWTSEFLATGVPFGESSHTNYFGVPAVVAGGLALYAADLLLRRRATTPAALLRVRLFAVAATGVLAGFLWLAYTNLLDSIASVGDNSAYTFTVGTGLWLFFGATLFGVLGSVLLVGVAPEPAPAAAEDEVVVYQVDVDTPPMGFEVPVNLPPADTYQPPEKS
jgi:hypothetical protein